MIFEGSYSRIEPEFSDVDTYTMGFCAYVTDTTTVVGTFGNTDVDEGGDTGFYELSVKNLWNLSNDGDDVDIFNVAGTWYLNSKLGFGARYGSFDAGGAETGSYAVFTEWFVTEPIALPAEYDYSELDDTDVEIEAFLIGARFRF